MNRTTTANNLSTIKPRRYWLPAMLLLGTLSTHSTANTEDLNREAQLALSSGNVEYAKQLLKEAYTSGNFNNQSLFLLGMATKELDRLDDSEKYLLELLSRDPEAGRVKLELAEVVYRNGRPREATNLLREVKMTNPPERVGATIDSFIEFIESGLPRTWTGYASIGQIYDTNANQGPDLDTILIYNLPFELDSDAKNNRDWATVFRAGGSYNRAFDDNWAFQAGINLNYTDYKTLSDYDALATSIWAGPSWRSGPWSFSVPYIFNIVKLGHDQSYYQLANGIAPQVSYQLTPNIQLQGAVSWQDKRYKTNSNRNSHATTFSPSARFLIDNRSFITAGAYIGEERSDMSTVSNKSEGINLSYFRQLDDNWSIQLSSAASQTRYRGIEDAFGMRRKDERYDLGLNISYLIQPWDAQVVLDHSYTKNRSGIDLYGYERKQTSLSVLKYF